MNTQPIRGYHHLSRAWYGADNINRIKERDDSFIDEVTFGLFFEDEGGTRGEMTMKWTLLGGYPTAQLRVFHDAWAVLAGFPDLIAALGKLDNGNGGLHSGTSRVTPLEFCALLDSLGFKDLTSVVNPYEQKSEKGA